MIDFLSWVGAVGGIGAVFAVLMFLIYRHDRKMSEDRLSEDRKYMEDRLTALIETYNQAVQENTKILAELFTYLKAKNGNRQ